MLGSRATKCIWKCLKHLFSTGSLSARTPPEAQTVAACAGSSLIPRYARRRPRQALAGRGARFLQGERVRFGDVVDGVAADYRGPLYRAAGFKKVVEKPGRMGGVDVVEETYELNPIP